MLAFFGFGWFSWGQAAPPAGARLWLGIGEILGLFVAILSALVAFREPRHMSGLQQDGAAFRRYMVAVWIEFGTALAGALILGISGEARYIPALVCAVVGLHFFPLAPILRDRSLIPLGVVVTMVAVGAAVVGLTTRVAPSTVTGFGAGGALVGFAAISLARSLKERSARRAVGVGVG